MSSTISLDCKFSFTKINALLSPHMSGYQITETLRIRELVLRGDKTWLYAVTAVKGAFDGTMIIQFKPTYDRDEKKFKIREFNVEFAEKGFLARGANWLLKKLFREKLDARFEVAFNEKFGELLLEMIGKYQRLELEAGLTASIDIENVDFENIVHDTTALYCKAIVKGDIKVILE